MSMVRLMRRPTATGKLHVAAPTDETNRLSVERADTRADNQVSRSRSSRAHGRDYPSSGGELQRR